MITKWYIVGEFNKVVNPSTVTRRRILHWTENHVFSSYEEADRARMRLTRKYPNQDFFIKKDHDNE